MRRIKIYWYNLFNKRNTNKVKNMKIYDTRKFTQHDYDIIINEYNKVINLNKNKKRKDKITRKELVTRLNKLLDFNKGKTCYSNIWLGYVNREDLNNNCREHKI